MKKRIGILILAMLMCFGGGVQVFAQTETEEIIVEEIELEDIIEMEEMVEFVEAMLEEEDLLDGVLRYADIKSFSCFFTVDKNGKGQWGTVVSTSSSTKITCYMELQKHNGSGYNQVVKNSTQTENNSSASFSDSTTGLDTNGSYRVYFKVTAYYPGGSETVTDYYYY